MKKVSFRTTRAFKANTKFLLDFFYFEHLMKKTENIILHP